VLSRTHLAVTFVLLSLTGMPLAAQTPASGRCPDGRISFVFLNNNSIFDTSDPTLDDRFRWAYQAANALHVKTRKWVIRQELLFRTGDCYDPFLLAESERLLRAYPFLAQVDVYGIPQADGSWHVIVDTHDDWSTRLDVRFRVDDAFRFEGFRLSELNLLGTGQTLGVFFRERDVTRDYGLTYWTPQVGRTRLDVLASAGRTRAGKFLREQVWYPFVGEVGHWSFGEFHSFDEQYFDYVEGTYSPAASPHVLVPLRERLFDGTLLRRFGGRGRDVLFGVGVNIHRLEFPGEVLVAPVGDFDDRIPADSVLAAPVIGQRVTRDAVRVSAVAGLRDVRWIVRRALDGLRGEEDVRLGFDGGVVVGRSIPAFGDNDVSLTGWAYGAAEAGRALFIGRARGESLRRLGGTGDWRDLFFEGAAFAYLRPPVNGHHTFLLRADIASGWRTRTPYQLTLGGERGVRGYGLDQFPGGRRALFTAEDRFLFGWPSASVMDVGGVLFADAGRIWPGDAPFGMDSGWRGSAGLGLRIAFPAGSRTPLRIDFAWPLERGTHPGDFRVRLSIAELIGYSAPPGDLQFRRYRPDGLAASILTPPERTSK
jgi:hypothetical protein